MSQLLQTCLTPEEAYTAIGQFAAELFPNDSGAVCVLNASIYLVETVSVWGESPPGEPVFSPEECWALRRGQAHAIQDPRSALLCAHVGRLAPANSLCVPLVAQGEALGVLHLRGQQKEAEEHGEIHTRLSISREQLAVTVAGHIALALANLRLRETLRTQSIRDSLTGLYNRRYLKESLEREVRRAARSQRPLAVLMLDVDRFKGFNDNYGHEAGDALLRELGSFLQKRTRGEDIACRFGGDEFLLILPEASLAAAERRAQQLCEEIRHLTVPVGDQYLKPPTVSVGVALYPEHGSTAEGLLRAADEALYRAKAQGRNRVALGQTSGIE